MAYSYANESYARHVTRALAPGLPAGFFFRREEVKAEKWGSTALHRCMHRHARLKDAHAWGV
jgi:hypothetical protein